MNLVKVHFSPVDFCFPYFLLLCVNNLFFISLCFINEFTANVNLQTDEIGKKMFLNEHNFCVCVLENMAQLSLSVASHQKSFE